ncbi:DUF6596 domain-containing protein [Gordonia rhizosphera NBRC 16068]|uniref:DUF6596 domain-containing protein n=1 Tax=Gordonia rhizosphera TaxID=83341 RepID=UPI003EE2F11D
MTPEDFRDAWPSVVRALATITGSLDDAEDYAAEAFARASAYAGVIDSLGAWCVAAGRRAWVDDVRRRVVHERAVVQVAAAGDAARTEDDMYAPELDDRVALLFVACDDVLAEGARLVLALRLVCGLSTAAIADLLGISTATAAARLTRAKKALASGRGEFTLADPEQRRARLPTVLACLSAMFTHGQRVGFDPPDALHDTAAQALSTTDALVSVYPDDTEVLGLRAVMRLGLARRPGRVDARGVALPSAEVDRRRWDRALLAQGLEDAAAAAPGAGRFSLEAVIAGLHSAPPTFADTDWARVTELYGALEAIWPSPAVTVARLVAASYAGRPADEVARALERIVDAGPSFAARDAAFALADLEWRIGHVESATRRYRDLAELDLPEPVLRFCRGRS